MAKVHAPEGISRHPWPSDYAERVYAGVLGKVIGVYLGRPFEGWSCNRLVERFGEVTYYVHEALGTPLIVADDDISGTFTFLRALEDNGWDPKITAEQIGETWLNYIVENRTVLWWGGMGASTEHTAFLRLKDGVPAPRSGSEKLNGRTVAEQIGAQIFIDGWGLICPGEPDRAAEFARRAASVSHDGEAIHGAQVIASLTALAFVETEIGRLLDGAVAQIPRDCLISAVIRDVREWHSAGLTWQEGFRRIDERYGYDKFGGGCHIVPNHALVIHALIHGEGDFSRSLAIVNTCGWDTDCNSGNVGCILGVRTGLTALTSGHDWRGPVADRLYLPTADGGRCVTDAAAEALRVVTIAYRLRGETTDTPKDGARYHFTFPGSVQGLLAEGGEIVNEATANGRMLALWPEEGRACRAVTATFLPPEARGAAGYGIAACPTLYSGQIVRATVEAPESDGRPARVALTLSRYDAQDRLVRVSGEPVIVPPGHATVLEWRIPDLDGYPVAEVGVEANRPVRLDCLTWDGAPETTLGRSPAGSAWRDAWVNALDHFESWNEPFRLIQDRGTGLLIQGCREWREYEASARLRVHLVERAGIAIHVQGLRRWVALLLDRNGYVRLVKSRNDERVLAEAPFEWTFGETHELTLSAAGNRYTASVDGTRFFDIEDHYQPLMEGAAAFVVTEGRIGADEMRVRPL